MLEENSIRIAGIVRESIVDGPGIRFVVFCQGCPHNCQGCHNPETHDFAGGIECSVDRIMEEISKNPIIKGVTFSGGEPFCQPGGFLTLGREVKERGLSIVIYTGFMYEELAVHKDEKVRKLLDITDILVDGPFDSRFRDIALQFRGSSNQRVIDMNKTRNSGEVCIWHNLC